MEEKMRDHKIVLLWDDEENLKVKFMFVVNLVGKDNVSLDDRLNMDDVNNLRMFTVRATDEQWDEITFQLGLESHMVYM